MKEEPVPTAKPPRRSFAGFISSRRAKMFGVVEMIALAGSCFVLVLVLMSYLYFLVPARSRRAALEADRTQLQVNLNKMQSIVKEGTDTKQTVDTIVGSLNNFETVGLVKQDEGRINLYGELNKLILKNGVRNTSGPSYTALEPLGTKTTPGSSVNTKWQSVYPGIGVVVTVEGSYLNLRHFIQDIERLKQFVIINQVELQRAENSSASATGPENGSGTRGSLVSLQLNMAMYFQREESANSGVTREQ
jgi:Tfp pilus assembly protein PilO